MSESLLHQQLKERYSPSDESREQVLERYRIDAVEQGGRLVEIQTANFGAIAPKLKRLVKKHKVLLVHPVCVRRWIRKGVGPLRRSPLKGRWEQVFAELVYMPTLLREPNLELEVLLTEEEELRQELPPRRRRAKPHKVLERNLREVTGVLRFHQAEDLLLALPESLPRWFTSRGLSQDSGLEEELARQVLYTLRALELVEDCGKLGGHLLYGRPGTPKPDSEAKRRVELRELRRGDWLRYRRRLEQLYPEDWQQRLGREEAIEQLSDSLRENGELLLELLRKVNAGKDRSQPPAGKRK